MNKEEIEELKDFTIDITDIDELALGLEVCSKKSNMVIQEFADTIIQLQQENQQLKDNWNKLKIWLEEYNIANEKWYSNELSNHDREYYKKDYLDCKFFINKFIDKMQELEKGDSNE